MTTLYPEIEPYEHGMLDLGAPLVTAWELAQAWPDGELVIIYNAGHASTEPGISEAVVAGTDRFAQTYYC